MAQELPLSRGLVALVDDGLFEELSKSRWYASRCGDYWYARRSVTKDGKYVKEYLHRVITSAPSGMQVDHINGNTLDNRRENLRVCEKTKNAYNQRTQMVAKSSRYKGVTWDKANNRWIAAIMKDQKHIHLGRFDVEEDAARAYNAAAAELFGEFARLNSIA